MSPEWFDDETLVSPTVVVSGRYMCREFERFRGGSDYVIMQRLNVADD